MVPRQEPKIQAIKFNYDPSSDSFDALNIRKNSTQFVSVPEWVAGTSTTAKDSLAAYSIKETKDHTLTIQATFQADVGPGGADIRAVFGNVPGEVNVLGDVREQRVTFGADGDSGYITFALENSAIWSVGVGIYKITWIWQYRIGDSDPWTPFDTTHHQIYVLLETPKGPWLQTPYDASNGQLPWTEVMDQACIWAQGAQDTDQAAAMVTKAVNNLGPSRIKYDTTSGNTFYSYPRFNCTEFLDRITGGYGLGGKVNCTDCATILSTFANILGCDLWQSRMGDDFECNEIIAIGYTNWGKPFGWGYSYHEVAWKWPCGVNDEVWDACLQVDGDDDPIGGQPHTPMLPIQIKFGLPSDSLLYRDRLAAPEGRASCNPQPPGQRRSVI